MPTLDLTFASGESSLSVSRFAVHEGISTLFTVSIWALSADPSIDLDTIVGQPASFRIVTGAAFAPLGGARLWTGICEHMALAKAEATGSSAYHLRIVPTLWLLTQRADHRIFQHLSIPDIVDKILARVDASRPSGRSTAARYPQLEYKVQYGESDYDLPAPPARGGGHRLHLPRGRGDGSQLTLDDALHAGAPRAAPPIRLHRTTPTRPPTGSS